MTYTSLSELSDSQKEELVASLATLVVGSATASGNSLSASYATLFSKVTEAAGGIDKFCAAPGSGGGGGGGGGGAAAGGEAEKEEEKEEEEEEADIGGGMDMFGGDDG